jgi:hypothetical protein
MKSCVSAVFALATSVFAGSALGQERSELLRVDELLGKASLLHSGQAQVAEPGAQLVAGDVLTVDRDSRVTLRLGRHGLIELGPAAEIEVERVPFATYAHDLRTILRLRSGYLRMIWKQPPLDINWPLFIYFGADRANLISGEYFFERSESRMLACAAEGQLEIAGEGLKQTYVNPDQCWQTAGSEPLTNAVAMEAWVAVRQSRSLGSVAPATVAAKSEVAAVTPKPTPSPAPKPPQEDLPNNRALPKPPSAAAVDQKPSAIPGGTQSPTATQSTVPAKPAVSKPPPPAAEPKPKPTAPEKAPPPAGKWAVNVASLPDRASADLELSKLKRAGFDGLIAEATVKGRVWYRVQVAGLSDAKAADVMTARLKQAGYNQVWVIRP